MKIPLFLDLFLTFTMKTYELKSLAIGIDGNSPPIVNAIDTLFCLCPRSNNDPNLQILGRSCSVDDFVHSLPGWLAERFHTLDPSPEPLFFIDDRRSAVIIKHGDSICAAWLSVDHQRLDFLAGMRKDRLTPLSVQPAIVPLLREILLKKEQLLLHSAAVRCPDRTGALIAAPGYGGKSTTTMSMLRLGAKLLGDDLVTLMVDGGQVWCSGIPEPFNLTDQTLAFFPECQRVCEFITKPHKDSKRVFSPRDIYGPDCLIADTPVQVAYFVRIDPDGPSIRRMNTIEAMQHFAAAHMFARNQLIDSKSTAYLLDIISRVKVYELHTGAHPDQLGHWLIANITDHATWD